MLIETSKLTTTIYVRSENVVPDEIRGKRRHRMDDVEKFMLPRAPRIRGSIEGNICTYVVTPPLSRCKVHDLHELV